MGLYLFLNYIYVCKNEKIYLILVKTNGFNFAIMKVPKIPKISPGAYVFQRPFLRGLFLEGLIYGGKFAFQNRLG